VARLRTYRRAATQRRSTGRSGRRSTECRGAVQCDSGRGRNAGRRGLALGAGGFFYGL